MQNKRHGIAQTLVDVYRKTVYDDTSPGQRDATNRFPPVFKFRSIQHFIGWIQDLDKEFPRASTYDTSDDGRDGFSLSRSLEDAYKVISKAEINEKELHRLNGLIRKIKRGTSYKEEGHEIEVAEYLAGSQNYWLGSNDRRNASKIIDNEIFISGTYNAGNDAETMRIIGIELLKAIYEKGVIPKRLIVVFHSRYWNDKNGDEFMVFIDVNFNDLNGIAKALHPSTFRRLIFRLKESYSGLSSGYGKSVSDCSCLGYYSLENESNLKTDYSQDAELLLGLTNTK